MKRSLFFFLCSLLLSSMLSAQVTLVPYKDFWKYLDNGSDQGTGWRQPAYSEDGWKTGPGKFGYGMDGLATTLGYGSNKDRRYTTYYFRKTITIANPELYSSFTAALSFDDGIVLYVNGNEVFRNNMPAGTVAYTTFASSSASLSKTAVLPVGAFIAGTNVLAVEVHQNSLTSSDVGFDLRLQATPDATAPKVLSSNRLLPAATRTNGTAVTFRVTYAEKVKGVDAADFTVTATSGTPGGAVTAVTPAGTDGATYDVTVSNVTGTGTFRLDHKASGTGITDMVGNVLSTGFTAGQTYTIDRAAPSVVSINRLTPSSATTNAGQLVYRATFSEAVTNVTAGAFTVLTGNGTLTGNLAGVAASGTAGTAFDLYITPVVGNGQLRLDLITGSGITDIAGNALAAGYTAGQVYTVDQQVPYVSGISRLSPLAEVTNGSSVTYRVVFSEKVSSVGVSDFSVVAVSGNVKGTIASGDVDAVGTGGTEYDVKVSSITGSGQLRIDLKATGTGITDAAKNACGGYTAGPAFTIDKTPPQMLSIVRLDPASSLTNAASVLYRATFSEPVSGVDAADFLLTTVSGTAKGVLAPDAVTAAGGAVYELRVSSLSGNGDLRLDLKSSGTGITDVVAYPLAAGFTGGQTYRLDRVAPVIQSILRQAPLQETTPAATVTWRVVFSEGVTGLDLSDFQLAVLSGTPSGELATLAGTDSAGTTWEVAATGLTTHATLRLEPAPGALFTDGAGNPYSGGFTGGETYRVDPPPMILSINRQLPLEEATTGYAVTWRLTFSEPVTGLDTADLQLVLLGGQPGGVLLPGGIVPVNGGAAYDVTVSGISRAAQLRLDLKSSGTGIADAGGYPLAGGFSAGQSFSVAPLLKALRISRLSPLSGPTGAEEATFRVLFPEKVRGVDATDFYTTTLSGDVRGTLSVLGNDPLASRPLPVVTAAGTDSTTFDVTVRAIAGNGLLRLDLKDTGTGIRDVDGQELSGGFTAGDTLAFQQNSVQRFASVTDLAPIPVTANTGDKPQSKAWFYEGKWWCVLATSGGTKIFRLDGTAWTEVLMLSTAQDTHADCRVAGNLTHILLFRRNSAFSYLYSVEYDAVLGRYKLWTQRTTRVNLPFDLGAESATLALDGTGRMWVASASYTDVNVRWSDAPYTTWSDTIRIAEGITDDDICALTPMPGRVGVLWSNQLSQRFGFKTHADGADPRLWSEDEAPGSAAAQSRGNGYSDDHLNIVLASDGALYCAVKTSYDSPGYPKLSLLVRAPGGGWGFYPVSSIEGTRGIAVLNESAGRLKIVYGSKEEGGDIIYRETALPNIAFGPPRTLISGRFLFNEASSTHQPTRGEVVILATNQSTSPRLAVSVLAIDSAGLAPLPAAPPVVSGLVYRPEAEGAKTLEAALSVFPNPASGPSALRFQLDRPADYRLLLFNSQGTLVAELKKGHAPAGGLQTVPFDAGILPGGLYLLRLQTAIGSKTLPFIVEK
ncbi:T9SS type A sorting domain-containing protein [Paraflavisolibacter sp. H34]|uniref:T9SS type A sorting domain-containing protein n=1 Tax=Huijunlia imazamoxiresistens TaxID=3127457 RepID=UPI00301A6B5F